MNTMTTMDGQAVGRVRHGGARGAVERVVGLVAGLLAVMLLLALAPSASASAAYDITQVGDAEFVSVTDANGKELSGQTVNASGQNMTVTLGITIDDMSTLAEGDTVDVRIDYDTDSYFKPWFFEAKNTPTVLKDKSGREVFSVQPKSNVLRLVRTGETATGMFSATVSAKNMIWQPDSGPSTTSTWHVGKDSTYTFANQPWKYVQCRSNPLQFVAGVTNGLISIGASPYNCDTVTKVATGADLSGISGDDLLFWIHLIPESGHMVDSHSWSPYIGVMKAADDSHYATSTSNTKSRSNLTRAEDVDVSTFAKAKANLKYGTYYNGLQSDGSYVYAINYGSRLPGRENSLKIKDAADDEATLDLMEKTNLMWACSWGAMDIRFADESVPNRVRVEMQSTESDLQTKTLTTEPVEPAEGQGQSAIRYDPNSGEGNAFRKVGDPGTAATTPEAATFTREGHTFTGWNTKADGTGTAYEAGATVAYPAEGDTMTLYAQWTPITYTVRFNGNGATSGMMDDLTVTYDAEATLPARRYARAGKTFTGWNTKKDGSGASYGDKAGIRNLVSNQDEVVVLYAQWADAMTVLPDTGGQAAGHAPFVPIAVAVTAAALAFAVLARRRATRHSI